MTALAYALAKELKDAGWAQPDFDDLGPGTGQYLVAGGKLIPPHLAEPRLEIAYSPSLEELIEACPEQLPFKERESFCLFALMALGKMNPGQWLAHYVFDAQWNTGYPYARGSSPKEAVARLWLALPPELRVNPNDR